jgi:hypothetical protein
LKTRGCFYVMLHISSFQNYVCEEGGIERHTVKG